MENELQHSACDEPRKLSYELIKQITNDLAKERIVGSGGFGTVYRGVYEDGKEIAVKILRNMSGFDCKEFLKEFRNLRGLKHQNVVELVGFCNESKEVLAVYEGKQVVATQIHTALCFEYVENGSLQKHITDEYTGLNWLTRYKIIKGICQGLKYLREGLDSPVMHLDLKPDNILLDQEMIPKIADFGLSRLFGEENTRKTISSVGTLGYLPPEYIELQVISETFDIFSLGAIITKIITGHEGYNSIADMTPAKFVKQVHDKWRKRLVQILKPRPLEVYCHQVRRCIEIALECIKRNRQDRPTIHCIVSILLETEIMIRDLGLQVDQFPDREFVHTERHVPKRQLPAIAKKKALFPERSITERPPGMSTHSPGGKTKNSKQSLLSALPKEPPLDLLKKMTNDFSDERKLGTDAFGTVYMGTLDDGEVIAVKRLAETSPVGCPIAFTNEIQNIMALHHQNIVKLVGYCHEEGQKSGAEQWKICFCRLCRIYTLPRIFTPGEPPEESFCGYMSPEYLYRGEISAQSDIYSLGLVILQITTYEKNIPRIDDQSSRHFIEKVRKIWTEGHIASVHAWLDSDALKEIKACIGIGLRCVEIDRRERPSTGYILDKLYEGGPIRPYFNILFEQPPELRFLFGQKRLTSRSLCLKNSTDDGVAFRLLTETPRIYLTKLPLCGIVPPNCTYTLCVTMREHEKVPPSNSNQFLSLQTRAVLGRYVKYVDNPDSVPEFLAKANDKVKEVKVTVSYELPARRNIFKRKQKNQAVQQEIEVFPSGAVVLGLFIAQLACEVMLAFGTTRRKQRCTASKSVEKNQEWLVVGGGDGYIYVYRYDTMEEVASVRAHGGRRPVTSLAVHPTHSLVLSASDDDLIKLWDWKNDWQCTRTFEWHNNRVTQVMFDPNDSNSFASTSLEGTVKIWNISSGMCIITLDGHPDGLHCLHYVTGDNRQFLVSGLSDGAAKIWDLQTDSCVNTLNGHANHLNALWWHPELPVLITGSADGTVQIWKSTDNTYKLENIIGFNLGSVNDLGYMKTLKRIVVGCEQGIVMMEFNLP